MKNLVTGDTLLIHVGTGAYPIMLSHLAYRHPNISFGPTVPEEFVNSIGYMTVKRTEKPIAQVVEELPPLSTIDGFIQQFLGRDFNEAELLQQLKDKQKQVIDSITGQLERLVSNGFEFTITVSRDIVKKHYLNIEPSNIVNILLMQECAKISININDDCPIFIKTLNNEYVELLPIEALEILENALHYVNKLNNKLRVEEMKIYQETDKSLLDLNYVAF